MTHKEDVRIQPQEKWQTVFGGREAVYHFQISAVESIAGRAGWSLRYENRTITRGECAFAAGPGQPGLIEVRLNLPPVKEGVMMPVQFRVELSGRREKREGQISKEEIVALWEETLRIFSEDAFAFKKEWFKELKIGLFDPEKKTQEAFEDMEIPFSIQHNIDALSEFDGSLLIVGSGLNFNEYRGLWQAILNLSVQKTPVLVLAPAAGSVLIPGIEGTDLPEPAGMRFLRKEIIHELNKKLDADAWSPDGKVVTSSMRLKTTRSGLVGEFIPGDEAWPWFEIDFKSKGGKIIVCGLAIIEKIKAGPTPRFLLAKLFEYLADSSE